MAGNILDRIIDHKGREVESRKRLLPLARLREACESARPPRPFKEALVASPEIGLIAEVKRASPSRGVIREDFDPVGIAQIYQNNGASAISVLTDEKFFRGDDSFLSRISETVGIPVLRKDFILDEYQIWEARSLGADAILLISDILSPEDMVRFLKVAADLQMGALVEFHGAQERDKILGSSAEIIGINNRDLRSFETSLRTTIDMIDSIPDDRVVVSESGIFTRDDMLLLEGAGVNAALVGEALMASTDIGAKVRELLGDEG